MNRPKTTNNDQDEAELLAALGSTAASASSYEESVLRDAKLKSAPQIALPSSIISAAATSNRANNAATLPTSSSVVPCGEDRPSLPDLSTLAPSTNTTSSKKQKGNASADVPHVLKVLSRTQNHLQSMLKGGAISGDSHGTAEEMEQRRHREIDLLRMKEQILLGYLKDVAGCDDAIIPQGSGVRKRRRSSGMSGGTGASAGDDYYGMSAVGNGNDGDERLFNKGAKKSSQYGKHAKEDNYNNTQSSSSSSSTSTSRLDRIKNGEQLHDNNFNTNSTNPQKRSLLKRNTMMSMKSQMRQDNGLAPLKSMEEERFDAERAKKRREERRKRRLKRQRAALGMDTGTSSEEEAELKLNEKEKEKKPEVKGILRKRKQQDGTGEEEKKAEDETTIQMESKNDINNVDGATKTSGVRWAIDDADKSNNRQTSITLEEKKEQPQRTHTKVFCPICQVILTLDDNALLDMTPDEYLAKHVAECQTQSRTRGGGRTLRRRTKPAVVDCIDIDEDVVMYTDGAGDTATVPAVEKSTVTKAVNGNKRENAKVDDDNAPPTSKKPSSIDDIDEFDYEDRVEHWIEHGLAKMGTMAERDSNERPPGAVVYEGGLEIPAWINDRLFPYQRTGVRWMWELHCQGAGGVVGDEMGLGKTVQVSSFLGAMAANRLLDSVLVVAPATMLAHWLSELAVWAPGLRRIMVHRSAESSDGVSRVVSRGMLRSLAKWLRKARRDRVNEAIDDDDYDENEEHSFCGTGYVTVTTYESVRRSSDEWINHQWSYVVLDEGQKIRNPDADVTLAVKRLRTPHRLLLSGTPIQNDLRELWSLYDFIFPGRLGTLPAFEAEFAEPIKRGGYSNASPMQVQLAYRCALVLRDLINPYLLRRQKKEVKEVNRMPGKTEQVLFCRLSSKQRSLYEEYLRSDEATGVMRGSVQLLKAVTVLRKICNHPDLITGPNGNSAFDDASSSSSDEDFYDHEQLADRSGKLQVLSKILPLWHKQGHKVIIFTQWRKMLNVIEQFTNQKGWKYARLDGNTSVASRQTLVDKFNTDASYFCILMTTKTGGVGLNITGANRVLLYDPDWNPQTDAQARERAWRFGQKKAVTVYRLITAGTIEEKIYQRQIFKTALTNQVLQDPKQRRLFSQKDLKDLFTLKADTNDVTETGEITKGRGVVEMNVSEETGEHENGNKQQGDNKDTLDTVMKSKGLCGVFDHDFVENSSTKKKPISEVEMEENARKVALKAARALKESSESQNRFEPTWTGSDETRQFGSASSAGVVSAGGNGMASSSSLLANLQNKRMQIASSGKATPSGEKQDAETKKYSGLLLRIKKYVRRMSSNGRNGPTTKQLLNEFRDVPDNDAAVFRSMLKSVALVKNGKWSLRGS
mmetsp:Transcript_36444/g.76804  ORF Transcript_36444/g.76804 Transcript_36444/m.76804 type:complete len:1371 (-) Transcript_36444:194-4306(-)|eukprot:CAMPEP_0183711510 /NCGR_PEP_ID=MMETSP0737-20130205/6995_1 /TAXON_ID=385413 /ORGANISM="Thalassiosira miniscula, Strain CCMP1093" /LENGTH=1370 /DNA_ID=CAMNT_0025940039 /DNA_START=48 /DNA_END=4160 /DNA_ORIENTATION=+